MKRFLKLLIILLGIILVFVISAVSYVTYRLNHVPKNVSSFIREFENGQLIFIDSVWSHDFSYRVKTYSHSRSISFNACIYINQVLRAKLDSTMTRIDSVKWYSRYSGNCNADAYSQTSDSIISLNRDTIDTNDLRYFHLLGQIKTKFSLIGSVSMCGIKRKYTFLENDLYYKKKESEIIRSGSKFEKRIHIGENWILVNTM